MILLLWGSLCFPLTRQTYFFLLGSEFQPRKVVGVRFSPETLSLKFSWAADPAGPRRPSWPTGDAPTPGVAVPQQFAPVDRILFGGGVVFQVPHYLVPFLTPFFFWLGGKPLLKWTIQNKVGTLIPTFVLEDPEWFGFKGKGYPVGPVPCFFFFFFFCFFLFFFFFFKLLFKVFSWGKVGFHLSLTLCPSISIF